MDTRLFRIFLMAATLALPTAPALAAEDETVTERPVIDPNIVRLGLKEADIDSMDIELGVSFGFMSIEDFGTHEVYAVRGAWHVTEYLFIEGQYGYSQAGKTSAERLDESLNLPTSVDPDLTYYNASLGFNALPGEVFIGENSAFNTDIYLLIGAGTTEFADDRMFTINAGVGIRFIALDWLAIHVTFQDLIFEKVAKIDPANSGDSAHNMQYTTSITVFF
ncbi:MAG: outer membrane beta-barrel domain-containing protein [Gammaproteobacteria bacterium]